MPPPNRHSTPQTLPHSHLRLSNKKSIENLLLFTSNRSSYDRFLGEVNGSINAVGSSVSVYSAPSPWLTQPSNIEASPCTPLVGLPTCDSLLASSPLGSCLSTEAEAEPQLEAIGNPSMPFPTVNQVSQSFPD